MSSSFGSNKRKPGAPCSLNTKAIVGHTLSRTFNFPSKGVKVASPQDMAAVFGANASAQAFENAQNNGYTPPASGPNAPTNLVATPTSTGVTITFTNPGSVLTYTYVRFGSPTVYQVDGSTINSVTINLQPATYNIALIATNAAGSSSPSAYVQFTVNAFIIIPSAWSDVTSPSTMFESAETVVYGNGVWLATGTNPSNQYLVFRSTDAISWTDITPSLSTGLPLGACNIAYDSSTRTFIVFGADGTNYEQYVQVYNTAIEPNAWADITENTPFRYGNYSVGIAYNGTFILSGALALSTSVGTGIKTYVATVTYRSGAWVWTKQEVLNDTANTPPLSTTIKGIATDGTTIVVAGQPDVSSNAQSMAYAPFNLIGPVVDVLGGPPYMYCVTYEPDAPINTRWVCGGEDRIRYSSDGMTWNDATVNVFGGGWMLVTYRNSLWVAAGGPRSGTISTDYTTILTSTDGVTWDSVATVEGGSYANNPSIQYRDTWFLGVGAAIPGSACLYSSSDLVTWNPVPLAHTYVRSIVYGGGTWCAATDGTASGRALSGVIYNTPQPGPIPPAPATPTVQFGSDFVVTPNNSTRFVYQGAFGVYQSASYSVVQVSSIPSTSNIFGTTLLDQFGDGDAINIILFFTSLPSGTDIISVFAGSRPTEVIGYYQAGFLGPTSAGGVAVPDPINRTSIYAVVIITDSALSRTLNVRSYGTNIPLGQVDGSLAAYDIASYNDSPQVLPVYLVYRVVVPPNTILGASTLTPVVCDAWFTNEFPGYVGTALSQIFQYEYAGVSISTPAGVLSGACTFQSAATYATGGPVYIVVMPNQTIPATDFTLTVASGPVPSLAITDTAATMRITPEYITRFSIGTTASLGPLGTTGFIRISPSYRTAVIMDLSIFTSPFTDVLAWLSDKNVTDNGNTILARATFASYTPVIGSAQANYACYVKINYNSTTSSILFSAFDISTSPGDAPSSGALTGTFMLPIIFSGYSPPTDVITGSADWA